MPAQPAVQTMTKTTAVTNTQLAVATLALLGATGLAFLLAPLSTSVQAICSDSDKGINLAQQGKTKGTDAATGKIVERTDACGTTPAAITEYYCKGSYVLSTQTKCASGQVCSNGACGISTSVTTTTTYITTSTYQTGEVGTLSVEVSPEPPSVTYYLMGSTNMTVAKFTLRAGASEDIHISQMVVSAIIDGANATGTVRNLRLIDDSTGAQIGTAVPALSSVVFGVDAALFRYAHAGFSGLSLVVPKGSARTLSLRVDFAPFSELGLTTTGQDITWGIITEYGNTQSGPLPTITATGASSGSTIVPTYRTNYELPVPTISLGGGRLYRAKLSAAWASDTPSGAASPSFGQTIGKIIVTNIANVDRYDATVNVLNLDISSNILNTATRTLKVYKDSLSTSPLATTSWQRGENFGPTQMTDAGFTDIGISSGMSKTFFVTLDTVDARTSNALSIRVRGLIWTDGVTRNIFMMGNDLPFSYKTFTY